VNGQLLNISQVLTVEGVTRLEDNEVADGDEVAEWASSFMVALAPS